jgi:hypothetical protein
LPLERIQHRSSGVFLSEMRPFLSLFLGTATLLCSGGVFGRGLVVSPSQLGLVGAAGSTVSDAIYVSSSREEKNNIRVEVTDFIRDENGEVREVSAAEAKRSCSAWIEVDQDSFTSPETGRVELRVTAKIPKEAEGSYWALVSFRSLPPTHPPGQANAVRIIPRIAVPVIVTVAGTEKRDLKISALHVTSGRGGFDAEAAVVNDGNVAVLFSGAFTLESGGANGDVTELAEAPVETSTSLPGTTTRVREHLNWNGDTAGLRLGAILRFGPGPAEVAEAGVPIDESVKRATAAAQ